MKRIKWIKNGVDNKRGNHRPVACRFNNSPYWFTSRGACTTHTAFEDIRSLAQYVGADTVEVKYVYNEDDKIQIPGIPVVFSLHYDDEKDINYYNFSIHNVIEKDGKLYNKYMRIEKTFLFA